MHIFEKEKIQGFSTAVKPADTRVSSVKSADTEILLHLYTDIYGKRIRTAQNGNGDISKYNKNSLFNNSRVRLIWLFSGPL